MSLFVKNIRVLVVGLSLAAACVVIGEGCGRPKPVTVGRRSAARSQQTRQHTSAALFETVAKTLNNLPSEVVLDLTPPELVLDDKSSLDGQEVQAIISQNPRDPEGGFNYLSVPRGNGNFLGAKVAPGDFIKYFAIFDEESLEHGGGGEAKPIELPVRRLDSADPQNALILDVSLPQAISEPLRIEIWRYSDRRMNEIRIRLMRYIRARRPAIAWEPTPDELALVQLVDRANQWFRNRGNDRNPWNATSLRESLPATVRESETVATQLAAKTLDQGLFDLADVRALQEAIWHRDISAWAKQDAYEKLDVARKLFDWTIRNVQLDQSGETSIVHHPWQVLMFGHGTAEHRAWVFAELCRQQQLDLVMLQIGESTRARTLPALFADGQLYLFDPALGLPIAGDKPDSVATLAEWIAEPERLRRLDVDAEHPYPISSDDLKTIHAQLVATPLQLSHRAAALEAALLGEDYVALASNVDELAESLKKLSNFAAVELWPFPFVEQLAEESQKRPQREAAAQRILAFAQRPRLWKARVLHFQGTKPIPVSQQGDPLAQPQLGHRDATREYQHGEIRLPERALQLFDPGKQALYRIVKSDANYYLGLLSYDAGKLAIAEDWFRRCTEDKNSPGYWQPSANYNLARTLESLGHDAEASEILQADQSPQRHGNLLRARYLLEKKTKKPKKPSPDQLSE